MDIKLDQPYTYVFPDNMSEDKRNDFIDVVRSLGFTAMDDQRYVNDRFKEELTVNGRLGAEASPGYIPFKAGVYFINSITTLSKNEQVNKDQSFYQHNRFLDYCILTAPDPPKDLRMHYLTEDPKKGPLVMNKVITFYPAKKLNSLDNVYRPATSWEINSWLIRRNVISFPKFYFDIFEGKVLRNEEYK